MFPLQLHLEPSSWPRPQPTREVVRPANQEQLSEAQLAEELPRMLTANDPAAPRNVARYNMRERTYKFEPMVEQLAVAYARDGWLLARGSEDARRQADAARAEADAVARFAAEAERAARDKEAGLDTEAVEDGRTLRNTFNFNSRAAQTALYAARSRATATEPPPTATASGAEPRAVWTALRAPALLPSRTALCCFPPVGLRRPRWLPPPPSQAAPPITVLPRCVGYCQAATACILPLRRMLRRILLGLGDIRRVRP